MPIEQELQWRKGRLVVAAVLVSIIACAVLVQLLTQQHVLQTVEALPVGGVLSDAVAPARITALEERLHAVQRQGFLLGALAVLAGGGLFYLMRWHDRKQQQVQAALRGQVDLLQTLIDQMPTPLYVKDRSSRFLVANRFLMEWLGCQDPADVIGKTDFDFFPQELAQRYYNDEQDIIRSGQPMVYREEPNQNVATGRNGWGLATKVPIRNQQGDVIWIVGWSDEITEQQWTEKQLVERSNLLRTLIDHLPEYIFVKDTESRFILANRFTVRAMGVDDPSELVGKTDFDFYPKELAEQYYADEQDIIRSGQPKLNYEEQATDQKTGVTRWQLTTKVPMHNLDGEAVGLVGMAQNITQLKQAEDDLIAAKEEAEAATRAKSEFLANMSHEIRTPMNGVIGMTSLLVNTPLDDEQREFVEVIRASGEGLLTIINDILDFSKIEAGQMDLEEQPFDVRQCVEEALDLVTPKAAEKHLDLAYILEDEVPGTVVGDVTRVRQILVNLLSNAVKFTEVGEVLVTVRNRTPHQAGKKRCELEFSIRDSGIGIPEDRLDRLFESFSQVDASTTRKYGGTGLGLAISRRLAELMGGRIGVESQEGVGSTFSFTIQATVAPSEVRIFLRSEQPVLNGRRVLIVDDNQVNRQILCRLAERWGMDVDEAASGPEALALIDQRPDYELLLLDLQMPGMDGIAVAKEAGRRSSKRPVMLLLTSMNQEKEMRSAAREHGIAVTLYKPIKPAHLYDALLEVFASKGRSREGVHPQAPRDQATRGGMQHRLLLAEDNLVNQKVALRLLEKLGYRADVVANGLEVLEALRRQAYDVVLMDVQMPEMDGLEAARRVHTEFAAQIRPFIIAMTANAMEGDRERCLEAGMDDYISKPVRLEDLEAVLQHYESVVAKAVG